MSHILDVYQDRYAKHQDKKRQQLKFCRGETRWQTLPSEFKKMFIKLVAHRRSQRTFTSTPVSEDDITYVLQAAALSPSSCNRQAIDIVVIQERNDKDLLSGLLVGGVGWCQRASVLLLLFAHTKAYKAEGEVSYMPYLDTGVMIQQISLAATSINLGVGYINPNIRPENRAYFDTRFNPAGLLFCGAIALGKYDVRAEETQKRSWKEVILKS